MLPETFHAKGQRCLSNQWLLISLNRSSTKPSEICPENTLSLLLHGQGKRKLQNSKGQNTAGLEGNNNRYWKKNNCNFTNYEIFPVPANSSWLSRRHCQELVAISDALWAAGGPQMAANSSDSDLRHREAGAVGIHPLPGSACLMPTQSGARPALQTENVWVFQTEIGANAAVLPSTGSFPLHKL